MGDVNDENVMEINWFFGLIFFGYYKFYGVLYKFWVLVVVYVNILGVGGIEVFGRGVVGIVV